MSNAATSTLRSHFNGLLEYDRLASARSLASLETVPLENRTLEDFKRALGVLSHIQVARRIWLARLQGESLRPAEWFPLWPAETIGSESASLDQLWGNHLSEVPESGFDREVRYTSFEGVSYASTVAEILTHVVNHGTYHRGQVARMVHLSGGQRATTDFIALTRRQL